MDIAATSPALQPGSASAGSAPSTINSDFDTFLRMMTTQLKNQDPLKPIDSADYAVQLATFSGVEQQTKTNKLLEAIQAQFGTMGMAQMAGWVGREARVAAPAWVTPGAAVSLSPNPAAAADRAVLVVRDASGAVVNRQDIAVQAETLDWMPVDSAGVALPEGKYSFQLESYAGDQMLLTSDVEVYAPVLEVRGGASGASLVLRGGIVVPASAVTALRS